ncbi:MAG: hypothetical protein KKG88_10955 [Proteobacteria bacterium]|nr:hypothetical protein [Pseudomonadota bacterium]MBU4407683.1 hypothetical protein [Pseudomonadota bacterium]
MKPDQENKSLKISLYAGLPPVIFFPFFFAGFLDKSFLNFTPSIWVLKLYSLFLFLYLWDIIFNEYRNFYSFHIQKSLPIDMAIIILANLSLGLFTLLLSNLKLTILSLFFFLFSLSCWSFYGLKVGRRTYFKEDYSDLKFNKMIFLFVNSLFLNEDRKNITHWNEYRYWIYLDSILCLAVGLCYLSFDFLTEHFSLWILQSIIAVVGFYVGILNSWRHKVVCLNGKAEQLTPADLSRFPGA